MPLLALADAKAQLNLSSSVTTEDVELQVYVDAVNEWFEEECGAVALRTVTSSATADQIGYGNGWARGNRRWNRQPRHLYLPVRPVASIVSATAATGGTVDVTGWTVAAAMAGAVAPAFGAEFSGFYNITYTVGYDPIPARLQLAARILIQHLWKTQRGSAGGHRSGARGVDPDNAPGYAYAIPNRVRELAARYLLPDGVY